MSPARLTVFFPRSGPWTPQPPAKRVHQGGAARHQKRAAKQPPKSPASPLESARRRYPGHSKGRKTTFQSAKKGSSKVRREFPDPRGRKIQESRQKVHEKAG